MLGLRLQGLLLNEARYLGKLQNCMDAFPTTTHSVTTNYNLRLRLQWETPSQRTLANLSRPMRDSETEQHSYRRARKRRRISTSTSLWYSTAKKMAKISEIIRQPLPEIQLSPIENTLKTLLLDVAEYSRQLTSTKGEEAIQKVELRFTGGWVRDKLLGIDSNDIDVAISTMTGYQFGMVLKEYLDVPGNLQKYEGDHHNNELKDATISLHKIEANPEKSKHLETVTTKIFGMDIDLVNLRKETYFNESRTPQMEFGTAEEDAMRRDATVNALFYNLSQPKIEDLTGMGLDDMKNKLIRTPLEPYQTLKDDPLRVLRLIRFASRLGYRIDNMTQRAMQDEDIRCALRLKISRERVGTEVMKMLRGPDPRGALQLIDTLNLYSTIFANHRDQVLADTSSWSLSYDALERLLSPPAGESDDLKAAMHRVRNILVRNDSDAYFSWMIAAFSPWAKVPTREQRAKDKKPSPPYVAQVSRDSLRSDNKTLAILADATLHFRTIIDIKVSFLAGALPGGDTEIRQQIGWNIRLWKKDWRLCVIMSIIQEVMDGTEFSTVIHDYDKFLAYAQSQDLLDVWTLRPTLKGNEIAKALGVASGPWMSKAVDLVIQCQLRHPEFTRKDELLEEIRKRKAELEIPG